jgi:hypothetical protein
MYLPRLAKSSIERVEEFDIEIKRRLKLEDVGTDGDKNYPHQWADLLDVREEFFQVYQDDDIKEADEESSHEISPTSTITYSWVVSRDSARIALTIVALNGLDIFACDIQNVYLTAPCRERLYTVASSEFGSDEGKNMIVIRALYGAGATFRAFLGEHLYGMGFGVTDG